MKETMPTMRTFIVTKQDGAQKIQIFLARKLELSNRAAKDLLDAKKVWVNRRAVWMAHHTVEKGDTVEVQTAAAGKKAGPAPAAADRKIRILAQDDDFLVADKPAGILSIGRGGAEELLRGQTGIGALRAVHRLDKETSGCLLFAKNDAARDAAVAVFKTRRVRKIYHTVVWGRYERPASTVRQDLDGEPAVSHIRREAFSKDSSFLRVRIETGRTHQIRRHLASIRYPILGDRKYGYKTVRDPRLQEVPRIMLHASELELPHPTRPGEVLRAHSPLPADFRRCLKLFNMGK